MYPEPPRYGPYYGVTNRVMDGGVWPPFDTLPPLSDVEREVSALIQEGNVRSLDQYLTQLDETAEKVQSDTLLRKIPEPHDTAAIRRTIRRLRRRLDKLYADPDWQEVELALYLLRPRGAPIPAASG